MTDLRAGPPLVDRTEEGWTVHCPACDKRWALTVEDVARYIARIHLCDDDPLRRYPRSP